MSFEETFFVSLIILVLGNAVFWLQRYKRCSSDKILVVYGKTREGMAFRCVHRGAAFVWPVIQDFGWLDLTPLEVDLGEKEVSADEKGRVKIKSMLVVAISKQLGIMENAAKRLLGLSGESVRDLASQIAQESMNSFVREKDLRKIKADPNSFADGLAEQMQRALLEIGLEVIDLNVENIEVILPEASPIIEDFPEGESIHPPAKDEPVSEEEPTEPEGGSPYSTHQLT